MVTTGTVCNPVVAIAMTTTNKIYGFVIQFWPDYIMQLDNWNMEILNFSITLLVLAASVNAFSCPEDGRTFYYADISTGCRVYHFCKNHELQTLSCPLGEAFDYQTSKCQDDTTVPCFEVFHHLHKRAVQEVHTISIEALKSTAVALYRKVRPMVAEAVKSVSPSIYATIETDYLPTIYAIRDDVWPIVKEKVLPQVRKLVAYGKRMSGKLFERVYKSYELSNSTHLSLVSITDIVQEFNKDLQPVLKMGRYFASRLIPSTRSRRSVDEDGPEVDRQRTKRQVPDVLMGFLEPVVKDVFSSIGNTLLGNDNSLTSKVLLPILYEMLDDPETRFDLQRLFWSLKSAFSPVISDMLSRQTFYTPEGTIIKIPRALIDDARYKLENEVQPILRKIGQKHLAMILRKASENVPLIFETLDSLKEVKKPHSGVLKDSILKFVTKHGSFLHEISRNTKESKYVNSYTFTEMMNDFKPIKVTLLQVFLEYLSKSQNSWLKMFFNRDSFLYRSITGSRPVYAKPSDKFGNPKIPEQVRRLFQQ
ncbi:uncharacterized protein LOC129227953 [Uloborus diversus]|uniref:uncharacterized protein LOC129227953 n=1 Tax=Uloborus diversus TaxID=327109 RepID=UPI002409E412|nr:uncharacterized protein LOC129227953 [Uloborus diversus]